MRVSVQEYRPDGQIAASIWEFGDQNSSRSTCSYDEAGLLLEWQSWNGDAPGASSHHEYEDGRLARVVGHGPDGSRTVSEEYTYADDGSYTRIWHLPEMLGGTNVQYGIEGLDVSISAPGTKSVATSYDREGRPTAVVLQNAEGGVVRRVLFTRDEAGRMTRAEVLLGDEPMHPGFAVFGAGGAWLTVEYTYDDSGRQSSMVRRMFLLHETREGYRYDDRGNRVEITLEERTAEGNLAEDGSLEAGAAQVRRAQTRFEFKYDEHGNWTERIASQRFEQNPDFAPGLIERRQIAYYSF
jgi:hypothetical protein